MPVLFTPVPDTAPGIQWVLNKYQWSDWHGRVEQPDLKVIQSCPTLCDHMDCPVHGILQARILEWVAFPFSRDLPNPGTEPRSPVLQADSLPTEPQEKPSEPLEMLKSTPCCTSPMIKSSLNPVVPIHAG